MTIVGISLSNYGLNDFDDWALNIVGCCTHIRTFLSRLQNATFDSKPTYVT